MMNPIQELPEDDDGSLGTWAIPLYEPEELTPTRPRPSYEPTSSGSDASFHLLHFRVDELPTEGFSPKLRRFDEAA